jgi:hypothetical protein
MQDARALDGVNSIHKPPAKPVRIEKVLLFLGGMFYWSKPDRFRRLMNGINPKNFG